MPPTIKCRTYADTLYIALKTIVQQLLDSINSAFA